MQVKAWESTTLDNRERDPGDSELAAGLYWMIYRGVPGWHPWMAGVKVMRSNDLAGDNASWLVLGQ